MPKGLNLPNVAPRSDAAALLRGLDARVMSRALSPDALTTALAAAVARLPDPQGVADYHRSEQAKDFGDWNPGLAAAIEREIAREDRYGHLVEQEPNDGWRIKRGDDGGPDPSGVAGHDEEALFIAASKSGNGSPPR